MNSISHCIHKKLAVKSILPRADQTFVASSLKSLLIDHAKTRVLPRKVQSDKVVDKLFVNCMAYTRGIEDGLNTLPTTKVRKVMPKVSVDQMKIRRSTVEPPFTT